MALIHKNAGKLNSALLAELRAKRDSHSLRALARAYGISHESVRRALKAATQQ